MWNELNCGKNNQNEVGRRPSESAEPPSATDGENPPEVLPCGEPSEMENGAPPPQCVGGPESRHVPWDWESGDPGAPVKPAENLAETEPPLTLPRLTGRRQRGRRLVQPEAVKSPPNTPPQRLLILDCWQRSGLPAKDFADLVGVSPHTLYAWKKAFALHGPAGLMDQPRGVKPGSRLPELTKRTILMLKEQHPDWGCCSRSC